MSKQENKVVKDKIDKDHLYYRLLEQITISKHIDRKELYKVNFLRGVSFGFGNLLATTVGILLLIWLLTLFGHLPLIGKLFETIRQSIQIYNK